MEALKCSAFTEINETEQRTHEVLLFDSFEDLPAYMPWTQGQNIVKKMSLDIKVMMSRIIVQEVP